MIRMHGLRRVGLGWSFKDCRWDGRISASKSPFVWMLTWTGSRGTAAATTARRWTRWVRLRSGMIVWMNAPCITTSPTKTYFYAQATRRACRSHGRSVGVWWVLWYGCRRALRPTRNGSCCSRCGTNRTVGWRRRPGWVLQSLNT